MTETLTSAHVGQSFRNCVACREYADTIRHQFHPESDVGPFDAACILCGHLHDGDVCPVPQDGAR